MTNLLPNNFQTTQDPTIASYNYEDIASGLGFIKFYLAATQYKESAGSLTTEYLLTNNQIYSRPLETAQADTTEASLNFHTSTFNQPRVIKGTAYVNLGIKHDCASTGTSKQTIKAKLSRFRGANETNLSDYEGLVDTTEFNGAGFTIVSFEIDITESNIQVGDYLRLSVFIDQNEGSGTNIYLGHDPMNRDSTNITPSSEDTITSSFILIPFKITDI